MFLIKAAYLPGETIQTEVQLDNYMTKRIKSMNVVLIAQASFTVSILSGIIRRSKLVRQELASVAYPEDAISSLTSVNWSGIELKIPNKMRPNMTSRSVAIRYFVELNITVEGLSEHTKIKVPITIGSEPLKSPRHEWIKLRNRESIADDLFGQVFKEKSESEIATRRDSKRSSRRSLIQNFTELEVIPPKAFMDSGFRETTKTPSKTDAVVPSSKDPISSCLELTSNSNSQLQLSRSVAPENSVDEVSKKPKSANTLTKNLVTSKPPIYPFHLRRRSMSTTLEKFEIMSANVDEYSSSSSGSMYSIVDLNSFHAVDYHPYPGAYPDGYRHQSNRANKIRYALEYPKTYDREFSILDFHEI